MCLACLATAALMTLFASPGGLHDVIQEIPSDIDALSVGFDVEGDRGDVRYRTADGWSTWQPIAVENEHDPRLRESNLVMLPEGVTSVALRTTDAAPELHPIRVSDAPISYLLAARDADAPRILTREMWGADESFLFKAPELSVEPTRTESTDNGSAASAGPSQRETDCEKAQEDYPEEFRASKTVRTDSDGNTYRWTLKYSKQVRLLVVHHTALDVGSDERSGAERMRALYAYHANNRGWGDVGYHYVIDEEGQMYEGKAGGDKVVGGHAYCANNGTVGIALMGNFELEQPTQAQMQALQWLLAELAERYDIDLDRKVRFHGELLWPIAGHGDLLSTDCPGYYVRETLAQVREHVTDGELLAKIAFPRLAAKKRFDKTTVRRTERASRAKITLPRRVRRVLNSAESRVRVRQLRNASERYGKGTITRESRRAQRPLRPVRSTKRSADASAGIRIRLTTDRGDALLRLPVGSRINGSGMHGDVVLANDGRDCTATRDGEVIAEGVLRITSGDGVAVFPEWGSARSRYRGLIECRVYQDTFTLINELPLEEYLLGLGEEPDTEPWQKQRAFAVAARTYAAWYLDSAHRKFPGAPFDGSDNPAEFQVYRGVAFEEANPHWAEAVGGTADLVMTYDGALIKPPYFSSSDGRTRTPAEAGWKDFPFAQIFASKADPWCDGMPLRGHGVGMSGCGAEGQAEDGRSGEEILEYYYPGTRLEPYGE